jgi:hypothetical protein
MIANFLNSNFIQKKRECVKNVPKAIDATFALSMVTRTGTISKKRLTWVIRLVEVHQQSLGVQIEEGEAGPNSSQARHAADS